MRYKILGLLWCIAAIAYLQRAALSVPALEVAERLKIEHPATAMGWVQSAWYLGYAVMQLPSGRLADRQGSRRALGIFSIAWSLATAVASVSQGFWTLCFCWFCMGSAQAGAFPAAAKAIRQIFASDQRARASGILASGMAIGGALAPMVAARSLLAITPWAHSCEIDRWRLLLVVLALPGIAWWGVWWMAIDARELEVTRDSPAAFDRPLWSTMMRSRSLALLCAQQFFRAAAMVFFLTWFPTFLQQTRHVSLQASGDLTSIAGIGGILGSLLGGFASDAILRSTGNRRLSRQYVAMTGMFLCAVLIVISYFVVDVYLSMAIVSVGVFCATFGGVNGYTVAIELGGHQAATVFSMMNMCGNLGAMLFPVTASWLVRETGRWDIMLFLFAGIMVIDAICWACLNPPGPLFDDEKGVDP